MIAADTNVVVRFIVRDDAHQAAIAERLLTSQGLYVSTGVLMEVEWVLRSTYRWSRARITEALEKFLSLEAVTADDPAALRWALARHAAGADLADMLHLIAAARTEEFATFDRRVEGDAGKDAPVRVRTLG